MDSLNISASVSRQPCTILLPLFNGSRFIDNSIQNLLDISQPCDEILIIDDGSTDLTEEKILSIREIDQRIKLFRCEHRGLVESLNFGIQKASHDFIARADVDDLYEGNRLTLQMQFLEENPDIVAVFTDYRMVNELGENLGIYPCAISSELTEFSLISSQRTAHPSVIFRKASVIAAGGYKTKDFPAEDLALWIRILEFGKIASLPTVALRYTVHARSITHSNQIAMRRKSLELRRNLAQSDHLLITVNKSNSLLLRYKGTPYRNRRILYFIQDLLNYNSITERENQNEVFRVILHQVIVRNFLLIPPIIQILILKYKKSNLK
jgi:glycosyltransferase involved in cell wall biosynthesis